MEKLFDRKTFQEIDRYTIEKLGIPELVLMEHAALAVSRLIVRRFPKGPGLVLAGTGNNGADAVACARILKHKGYVPSILLTGDEKKLTASAKIQLESARKLGISVENLKQVPSFTPFEWVIDGIFGIGLDRAIEGDVAKLIGALNQAKKWVVSVDTPSGLCVDSGRPMGTAVQACETVTFGFLKRGLVTGLAADFVGELCLDEIQIPRDVPFQPCASLLEKKDVSLWLPRRKPSSHKGSHGQVFIWAGAPETQGACALAAIGALQAGAGLCTVVGEGPDLRARLAPEVMCKKFEESLLSLGAWVVGPGLGKSEKAWEDLKHLLASKAPLVVDGDALNLVAQKQEPLEREMILTPHPKEAARLLGISVEEIEADRYRSMQKLREKFPKATVVLKGRGSLIGSSRGVWVVNRGNSAQAKGGSGDVLSGIIGSFLAQGLDLPEAAALGVYVHGRAAEWVSQEQGTERSALASEVVAVMDKVFHELEV